MPVNVFTICRFSPSPLLLIHSFLALVLLCQLLAMVILTLRALTYAFISLIGKKICSSHLVTFDLIRFVDLSVFFYFANHFVCFHFLSHMFFFSYVFFIRNGHMLTHRNKKPYECKAEGCGKSYCDARSLRRHTENHHTTVATAPTTPNQSISSTGPLGGMSLSPSTASGKLTILFNVHLSFSHCLSLSLSPTHRTLFTLVSIEQKKKQKKTTYNICHFCQLPV